MMSPLLLMTKEVRGSMGSRVQEPWPLTATKPRASRNWTDDGLVPKLEIPQTPNQETPWSRVAMTVSKSIPPWKPE